MDDGPVVLNWRTEGGVPEGAVYVGRGSKWGNPFMIGKDGNRETVILKYKLWLRRQASLLEALGELRGKDLVCYCAPKSCHADHLLELANE
jgi:hypothetical protein